MSCVWNLSFRGTTRGMEEPAEKEPPPCGKMSGKQPELLHQFSKKYIIITKTLWGCKITFCQWTHEETFHTQPGNTRPQQPITSQLFLFFFAAWLSQKTCSSVGHTHLALLPEVAQVPDGLVLQLGSKQRVGLRQDGDQPAGWWRGQRKKERERKAQSHNLSLVMLSKNL